MIEEIQLKNCPLCDSDDVAIVSGIQYAVKCHGCWHIRICNFKTKKEAIKAWNQLTIKKIK